MLVARWLRVQLSGQAEPAKLRMTGTALFLGLFLAFCWIGFDSARRVALLEMTESSALMRIRSLETALARTDTTAEELRTALEALERKMSETNENDLRLAAQVASLAAEAAGQGAKLAKLLTEYATHTTLNLELATSVEAAHKSLNETTKMIASFHEYFRKREQQVSNKGGAAERSLNAAMVELRLRVGKLESQAEGTAGGAQQAFRKIDSN
jgi:chromosome segregation ATPase